MVSVNAARSLIVRAYQQMCTTNGQLPANIPAPFLCHDFTETGGFIGLSSNAQRCNTVVEPAFSFLGRADGDDNKWFLRGEAYTRGPINLKKYICSEEGEMCPMTRKRVFLVSLQLEFKFEDSSEGHRVVVSRIVTKAN